MVFIFAKRIINKKPRTYSRFFYPFNLIQIAIPKKISKTPTTTNTIHKMLVNSKEIFLDAIKNKYALGAFNFVNMEVLQGILETAVEENSPVIVQCSTGAIKYAGGNYLSGMVINATKDLPIPVIWNLDHGKTYEDCVNAIDLGFTNVMIDASHLPYEENIALTKKVVDYAHTKGVTVE